MRMERLDQPENEQLPNCQIPVAINPAGFLRFEVSDSQAETIHTQLTGDLDELSERPPADACVTIEFVLTNSAQESVHGGVEELQDEFPRAGAVSIPLTTDPVYALTVLLNKEQISEMVSTDPQPIHLSDHDESSSPAGELNSDDPPVSEWYVQEFQLTPNAGLVTARQIKNALNGTSDPVDSIDFQELRERGFEMSNS